MEEANPWTWSVRWFTMIALSGENDWDDEYYRQQVVLHVPWRSTSKLKNGNSFWAQVNMDHELEQTTRKRTALTPQEEYIFVHVMDPNMALSAVQLRSSNLNRKPTGQPLATRIQMCILPLVFWSAQSRRRFEAHILSSVPDVVLSTVQQEVFECFEAQAGGTNTKRLCVNQGKERNGKLLLISFFTSYRCLQPQHGFKSSKLLAPTGVAINIFGATLHAILHILVSSVLWIKGKGVTETSIRLKTFVFWSLKNLAWLEARFWVKLTNDAIKWNRTPDIYLLKNYTWLSRWH